MGNLEGNASMSGNKIERCDMYDFTDYFFHDICLCITYSDNLKAVGE